MAQGLKPQVPPEWFERYAERIEDYRLPKDKAERDALSTTIGEDGYTLLARLEQAATQPQWAWLKEVPAVRVLEQTGAQPYRQVDGHTQRLTPKELLPVSEWVRSPYATEVRYGRKREFDWIGYKVHLTECCDDDMPHLSTQVETARATQQDHRAGPLRPHSDSRGAGGQTPPAAAAPGRRRLYQRQTDPAAPRPTCH